MLSYVAICQSMGKELVMMAAQKMPKKKRTAQKTTNAGPPLIPRPLVIG